MKINFTIFKILLSECWRGKTLSRTLHNIHICNKKFNGSGIDFGSKFGTSSYYRFIKVNLKTMRYIDFYSSPNNDVIKINFEKKFNLKKKANFALVFNVLDDIYNYQNFINSIYKSLKKNSIIEGVTPFIDRYALDPNEYWRFTPDALRKILEEAQFKNIEITPIGIGMFTCATHLVSKKLRFRPLIFISWLFAILIDEYLCHSKHKLRNETYFTALAFSGKKT